MTRYLKAKWEVVNNSTGEVLGTIEATQISALRVARSTFKDVPSYRIGVGLLEQVTFKEQDIIITSDYLDSVVSLLEDVGLMNKRQVAAYDKLVFPTHISLPYSEKLYEEVHETLQDWLGKVGYTSFSLSIQDM